MEERKQIIGYIIVACIAIFVISIAWLKFEPTQVEESPTSKSPQGNNNPEVVLPEFAFIEERDGSRVLVHERDGYELILQDSWSVYPSTFGDGTSVQDFVEPGPGYGGLLGCRADITKLNYSLEKELMNLNDDCKLLDCNLEKSNDNAWTIVRLNGEFVGSGRPIYLKAVTEDTVQKIVFQCIEELFESKLMEGFNYEI